jgi:transcriptional regulator with XRE-family HTH domain
MPSETLGQRIKKRRLGLGMTQRQLAEAVGITVPYMSKIEAGRETPTEEKIRKVATALRLDPDELILAAGRVPGDVMDLLAADPARALDFLRQVRK